MKLTKAKIDALNYRGGWDVRWDDAIPGFGLRVYPSGKKAFVLSYRVNGIKHMMVLGRYGVDLTVQQARTEVTKKRAIILGGGDPLEEKRKDRQGRSFGDLADAYVERYARVHKRTWKTDRDRLNRHIPPSWRARIASNISRQELARLHSTIGADRPYEANRTLDLLRVVFRFGIEQGYLDEGAPNPATGIKKYKEEERDRWVTPEELPRLAQAIDQHPNVYVRAALWLYLLTGLRKAELLSAKWKDVDWPRATLRLPHTKAGKAQTVSLSHVAVAILQAVPRQEGNEYILCGAKPGRSLVNIDRPWRAIRNACGLPDLRLHDLRRSTGSWLTQAGVDLNLIKAALRHANINTTLTYSRLGEDAARDAMEEHGKRIMEAAGKRRLVEALGKSDVDADAK